LLTEEQKTHLKGKLLEEKARLESELAKLIEELSARELAESHERASYGDDLAEDASEIFEMERTTSLKRNVEDLLAQVKRALHKLEHGTYGVCERCGNPIEYGRLEAIPYATLCVRCKALEEAKR
jgi:DnaK suppressor protein